MIIIRIRIVYIVVFIVVSYYENDNENVYASVVEKNQI